MTTRGRFITLEGGEGVGKSTQLARLGDWLRGRGIDVLLTREPGGTAVGEAIRAVLLDCDLPTMHADTELLLMYAARVEHVRRRIEPHLAAGGWVLSDRFADASHVYQGAGRGIDPARIEALERWALGGFRPDLTFLLDMPVAAGMARVRARGAADRFERERLAFFERVRAAYLARADREPDRFEVVDADRDADTVSAELVARLQARWPELAP